MKNEDGTYRIRLTKAWYDSDTGIGWLSTDNDTSRVVSRSWGPLYVGRHRRKDDDPTEPDACE